MNLLNTVMLSCCPRIHSIGGYIMPPFTARGYLRAYDARRKLRRCDILRATRAACCSIPNDIAGDSICPGR